MNIMPIISKASFTSPPPSFSSGIYEMGSSPTSKTTAAALSSAFREGDYFHGCSNSIEVSETIKDWFYEQDQIRPFCVGWSADRKLESELKYFGFADVSVTKLPTHAVFIFKGKTGNSRCGTSKHFEQLFRKVARESGIKFRKADAALTFSRGRFEVVLCLPDGSGASEILPDNCEDHAG